MLSSLTIPSRQGYDIPCRFSIQGGESLVCVVVHGFGSSQESPSAQLLLERLPPAGIGVATFDLPAHGHSPVDGRFLRLGNCFADLAAVENAARQLAPASEIVYFGSSFGAYTVLLYLATQQPLGRRAFLRSAAVCMPALFHHKTPEQEAELAQKGFVTLGARDGYTRPLQITPEFTADLDQHDLFALWRPAYGEIAMIHGSMDQVIPLTEAQRFATKFQAPLTVVCGGDHRLSIPGAPQQVLECAFRFFTGLSAALP